MTDGSDVQQKSKYEIIVHKISRWMAFSSFVTIVVMLLAYTVDGLYRFIFGHSLFGLTDIVELSLVFTIFLGIAYVATIKGHINVNLATSKYPERTQYMVNVLVTILGIVYFALMTWQLGARGWAQMINPSLTTANFLLPIGPFLLIISLGCLMIILVLFGDLYRDIYTLIKRPEGKS